MAISGSETQTPNRGVKTVTPPPPPQVAAEVESVKCDSCGFTEECTISYISRLRQRYQGHWLCGLCIEAVKDEVLRSERFITTEEALNRHIRFCREFKSSSPPLNEIEHPIFVMGRILRRSLDSPRPLRSNSTTSLPSVHVLRDPPLLRSESCFSSISG
ncbi:hypothetical protein TanjilG_26054 [Lupinus angustifolius]|uniref:DUF1677 family protein n=1 Tax=Lupinus angustifolius TaxID=3871 RepID=A0A4P1R1T1_LUPAN|nr:PREDICTED: uncharacterized protein LOC109361709 [Lupinus angustifolius]OIV99716.1 hypothetical protein TanjilG_26054 [Lupinus angustifolius]